MIKQVFILLLLTFVLLSCDVTFPKETLIEDTQSFIKKETDIDSSASVYGTTLYLDVVFDDLTTNDSNKIKEIYKKLQDIASSIIRVPLSSDKDIKIVVLSAFDSQYKMLLRIFANIDDIKKVSHSYISRTDYLERQFMEIETEELAKQTIADKHDISLEEYIGRLCVSKVNSSGVVRLLSILGQNLGLKFSNYDADTLIFQTKNMQKSIASAKAVLTKILDQEKEQLVVETIKRILGLETEQDIASIIKSLQQEDDFIKLIKELFEQELVKDLQKYKISSIKSVTLLDEKNNTVFNITLPAL